jgi:sulfite reductase (NADPH) flavoprotein alpha-component
MLAMAPSIPDHAPFSPEQREWLNGLLAGIFTGPAQSAAEPTASLKAGIYFASQSGTAERLAKKLARQWRSKGHTVEISTLDGVSAAALRKHDNVLLLVSTYGEGEPPQTARHFRETLFAENGADLNGLHYSVFCLGDRHYEHFCKFGIEVDERLHALGANRISARVESDVEVEEPFATWLSDLESAFSRVGTPEPKLSLVQQVPKAAEPTSQHNRDNPFHAELLERRILTAPSSSKRTIHVAFSLRDSGLTYEAGDACGVLAHNNRALVDEILALLPFNASDPVTLPKVGQISIGEALREQLQVTRATRKMLQVFADKSGSHTLKALLPAEQGAHLETYLHGRGLIDLLEDFPGAITTADDLVLMLPRLAPRLYSISSSPAAHAGEVHCTVGVVRYRTHNRERGGVASTMLDELVTVGSRHPIYVQPNKKFRLPLSGDAPVIMIGPGTGIAPFRGFLHHRQALGHTGRNWLFFGDRSGSTDFLYRDEFQAMTASGHLTRLDTAFSRDQEHKVYVQDRMIEHGAEMWRWLNDGAQIYVCGDASRMAKDVDAAIHKIAERHGSMDPDGAREFVAQLHDDRRYHRDVY